MSEIPKSQQSTAEQGLQQALDSALQLAIKSHQAGNLDDAETLYRNILESNPNHPEANHNLGVIAIQMDQVAAALPLLTNAVQADPGQNRYWLSYIEALMLAGETEAASQALTLGRRYGLQGKQVDALAERLPDSVQADSSSDVGWTVLKKSVSAGQQVKNSQETPNTPRRRGIPVANGAGGRQPATKDFEKVLSCYEKKKYSEAATAARALTKRFPRHGRSWQMLALSQVELGRTEDALEAMQRAAELLPEDATVHNALGRILYAQNRFEEAQDCLRRALDINPNFLDACRNLGPVLGTLGHYPEAEACLRRALEIGPETSSVYNNIGWVCRLDGRMPEAETALRRALELNPEFFPARHNSAIVFKSQGRLIEAEAALRRVLESYPDESRPDHLDVLTILGAVLAAQGRHAEGEDALRRVLRTAPIWVEAHDNLLFLLNHDPDRTAEEIFAVYRDYEEWFGLPLKNVWREHVNQGDSSRRLKVGYVSPDFRFHPMQGVIEPLLAHHDKQAVEVYLYAASAGDDETARRYRTYADHWISTLGMPDQMLAERIRADGIDVLVDLGGHMPNNRLPVFAYKPAPVAVSGWGYGGTTGLSAIDYLLTDVASSPAGSEHLFAEMPWRMQMPSQVYRPAPGMGAVSALPVAQHGKITFGVLAQAICINDRTVRVWAEILKRVAGARLVIDGIGFGDEQIRNAMAQRFAAHGIGPEKLEMGHHSPSWEVMRGIDIGLDSFPHNAGPVMFDTLYMGIPYVTLAERPGVGCMGSSILEGLGHPEWVARNEDEYIEKAVAMAADLPALGALRSRQRAEMEASPLMDEQGFARKVESAYREMWSKWCAHVQDR
jgi:protein O-GlcNAc transferase